MTYLLGIFPLLLILSPLSAAPAMTGPECQLLASVEQVEQREELYQPDSWRQAWGLPPAYTYTDIKLHVIHSHSVLTTGDASIATHTCQNLLEQPTFQLRPGALTVHPGDCIHAQTQFSGDEFAMGQWLYAIQILDTTACHFE